MTTGPQEPLCSLAVQTGADGSTVVISGELCFSSSDMVEQELAEYDGRAFSAIDLRGVRFIDLSGLKVLRRMWSRPTLDGHLPVVIPAPCVQRLIGLLEMHDELVVAEVSADPGPDDPPRRG